MAMRFLLMGAVLLLSRAPACANGFTFDGVRLNDMVGSPTLTKLPDRYTCVPADARAVRRECVNGDGGSLRSISLLKGRVVGFLFTIEPQNLSGAIANVARQLGTPTKVKVEGADYQMWWRRAGRYDAILVSESPMDPGFGIFNIRTKALDDYLDAHPGQKEEDANMIGRCLANPSMCAPA